MCALSVRGPSAYVRILPLYERASKDIDDEPKFRKPFGPHGLYKTISAL